MLTAYRRGRYVLRILWQTLKRFESMERRRDAAALTYTTLFALVPVITVTYSILSAIPALQKWGSRAHSSLLTYVMPEGSDVISKYLVHFSEQARDLTWVGVLALFVTALLLMQTIEQQFNRIWQVEVARSRLQRFFRYWAVLSLGPLLFASAQAVSSLLTSLTVLDVGAHVPMVARLVPVLMTAAAITFVYMMVPNCRVPWKNALIAALFVATVFETGKFLFAKMVGLFPSYQLIYGAFAAVPLFLMWIYVSWMLLLLGAELSYALGHPEARRSLDPVRERLLLAFALYDCQQKGRRGLDEEELRRRLRWVPAPRISALLQLFHAHGWVSPTQDQHWVWLPDLRHLSVREFLADVSLQELLLARQPPEDGVPELEPALQQWLQRWQGETDVLLDESLDSLRSWQGAATALVAVDRPVS